LPVYRSGTRSRCNCGSHDIRVIGLNEIPNNPEIRPQPLL
jgi:hypothetical protein